MHDHADTVVDADIVSQLVGDEEVDIFGAWIAAVEGRVVDQPFVADVGGNVIAAEAEGPATVGVGDRKSDVVVGVNQRRGLVQGVKASPKSAFHFDLELAWAYVAPAVDLERVAKGDVDHVAGEGVVVEAPAGRVGHLAGVGDKWSKKRGIFGEPDAAGTVGCGPGAVAAVVEGSPWVGRSDPADAFAEADAAAVIIAAFAVRCGAGRQPWGVFALAAIFSEVVLANIIARSAAAFLSESRGWKLVAKKQAR